MKRLFRFAGFAFALATLSTPAAPADARSAPGSELFANAAIRRFKIEIAESELEKLQRENRTYVRATVTVDGKVFKDVGVRLKGRGSFRPLNEKPSLALKFDEFISNQQFHGLNRIMLNNSSQDSTYLSEYLGTSLFRDAGVPAARVTHARVELNGRELGFYVLVEAMNKSFLERHFANATGNLYEGYAQDIDRRLELDEGTEGDQSDVQALVAAARLPVGERMPSLRNILDVDNFASFLAVCMLIAQHDSYPLNHNNYRLYREPDSGRFVMIAHGIDGSFTQNAMSIVPPMKYILTRGMMETPEGQELYRERVSKLFTNIFRLDVMTNRIRIAAARLEKAALTEREQTNIAVQTASFVRRVSERHVFVSKQFGALAPATADGGLASFQRDFREGQPKSGWRYLWNLNGPIGDQRNYAELKWDGQRYTFEGGRTYPGPSPARFLRITPTGGHPGQGFGQGLREVGNEIARYAIIAFTAPDSGRYRIVKSRLSREQGSLGGHLELRVFVDDREIAPALYCRSPEGLSFDREVGEVSKGSIIYIAIGPNETDSDDSFGIDFSITR